MKKYFTVFKISLSGVLSEKETLFIWSISNAIGIISIMVTWLASDKFEIAGYTKPELISYYLLLYFLEQIIGWYIFWNVREAIMNGSISNYLIKPIDFFKHLFMRELAYKIISMLVFLILGIFLVILLNEYLSFQISIVHLIKLLPSFTIGISIMLLSQFLSGCITFFWTESRFVHDFLVMLRLMLGGKLLPISFFPSTVLSLIKLIPFRYTFSFSSEIIFNKVTTANYFSGILVGTFWVIVLALLSKAIWKAGLKKFTAFGS